MPASGVEDQPPPSTDAGAVVGDPETASEERFRPLPTGTHGLDPDLVKRDQRERLQRAMIDLIAEKGYPSVRIVDLAKLAHVSQPSFYNLYADKEELFLSAYEEIAGRTARTVVGAYEGDEAQDLRLRAAMSAFAELAAAEPEAMSLLMLGAFGAGSRALERRRRTIDALEANIQSIRDGRGPGSQNDMTVKGILGGVREVTAARLRGGRVHELGGLVDELADWALCYPQQLPPGLDAPPLSAASECAPAGSEASERARRAQGRLPSGRSDLPRQFIVKSQRERIVDATAAIVAEKGLGALTIPEIAKRASVSNQTFYSIYSSKHDAFLGAQKVGLHQALQITVETYEAHAEHWPCAIAAGLGSLIDYLASEPSHAHLILVDTFGANPEAIEIRNSAMDAFAAYLRPGYELAQRDVPEIAAEAVAGGIWQVLHHYIESDRTAQLPGAAASARLLRAHAVPRPPSGSPRGARLGARDALLSEGARISQLRSERASA